MSYKFRFMVAGVIAAGAFLGNASQAAEECCYNSGQYFKVDNIKSGGPGCEVMATLITPTGNSINNPELSYSNCANAPKRSYVCCKQDTPTGHYWQMTSSSTVADPCVYQTHVGATANSTNCSNDVRDYTVSRK